jgi:hypothetical protein
MEEKIVLNGRKITEEAFEEKKKKVEKMRNAQLVEVSPNNYRIRLHD